MTYLSQHPITVDGVRLDTLAWGIEASGLRLGGPRSADQVLAGLDGVVASTMDAREPSTYSLGMFVRGTDEDGTVPAGRDGWAVVRANLDHLLHVFGRNDTLLDVHEVVEAVTAPGVVVGALPGTERQFYAKVQDAIEPILEPGAVARFSVVLTNPGCYWRDVNSQDWSQAGVVSGTTYQVTTLDGSSAPVDDAVLLLTGPANAGTAIYDDASGAFVRLNVALAAGTQWRVNVGTWASRTGALTLGSADTTGTDQTANTDQGGAYPRLLRLVPKRTAGATTRTIKVRVVGGGFTAATALSIRSRRAYL